jgi:small-conductance mechanosensitive channel
LVTVLIRAPRPRIPTRFLTAVAVAIMVVVAIKGLILCRSGGLLRASSRAFPIGDRIEIAPRSPPGEVGRLENRITLAILERLHPEAPAGARVEGVP